MATAPPPDTFRPGVAAIPATQVEISVSCRNNKQTVRVLLPDINQFGWGKTKMRSIEVFNHHWLVYIRNLTDKDVFSKSDPMCVMYTTEFANDRFVEFGRTEMIKDTLNPDFVKKFIINYYFEQSQKLKFELYDVDSASAALSGHDFLGKLECTLGEIVGAPSNKLDKQLVGVSNKPGRIIVRSEEVANSKDLITLHFQGKKLDKKDFFGKSDPFLVISRSNEDGSYTVVHRTEVIKNTLNPTWRPFQLKSRVLCNGDYDRMIKVDCYDWDSDGSSHDLIGIFQTSLRELTRGPGVFNEYEVVNPKKQAKKKSYTNSGKISLLDARVEVEHSFLDYVQGGMELNFTVAVDFTASNGDPNTPTSLHYINPYQPNQYATALQAVGNIIQDYDSDKMFPALGFGARLPPNGVVSHEFPLNGNPANPYCAGIHGILESYHRTLQAVQLYGPTNFSPVINHVAKFASAYPDGSHYFVLLILTDGVITDMDRTISSIIAASALPMSIIIVGVGEADFAAMERLDADNVKLSQAGRVAERDIVQFVPFREFIGGRFGSNLQMSQAYLAKEVLAEVPDQIVLYMKKKGFKPKPAPPSYNSQVAGESSSASVPSLQNPAAPQQAMW